MSIFMYYLIIGVMIQTIVVIERTVIRKLAKFKDFKKHDWVIFILLSINNVLAWPMTIIFEGYNIKNGN